MDETRNKIKNMLTKLTNGMVPEEIINEKTNEYMKSNNSLDMASFIFIDLSKLNLDDSKQIQIQQELESNFNIPIKKILENSKSVILNNIKPGQMPIDENHKLVDKSIQMLCEKFTNNNIDYYLVGAIPCYLLTGEEDTRYHDDIDLMLNEKDIPKVKQLLEGTDFDFQDKRVDTPKRILEGSNMPGGDHEVIAQHKYTDFHLGFFCFERGKNGEVIHKEYFKDNDDNLMVYKHMLTPEQSKLNYDDNFYNYKGVKFKMASLESIYNIKKFSMNNPGREKDRMDVNVIEKSGKLNVNKLNKIKNLPKIENKIETIGLYNNNKQYTTNTNNKVKTLIRKPNNYGRNNGFINTFMIALIVVLIFCMLILIYYSFYK